MEFARGRPRRNRGGSESSGGRSVALPLLLIAATAAPGRLVLKPSFLVERLLPCRENELLPAVPTLDSLVTLHHEASEALPPENTKPLAGE